MKLNVPQSLALLGALSFLAACLGPGGGGSGGLLPSPCVANPALPQCSDVLTSDTQGGVDGVIVDTTATDTPGQENIGTDLGASDDGGPIDTDTVATCPVGTTRCNGNVVETCTGIAWQGVATCSGGDTCIDGACEPPVCEPQCSGKVCGPDGCGGTCGTCEAGAPCVAGQCEGPICTPSCGECGPDGCGGSCGNCPGGWNCVTGACVEQTCTPDCAGKNCGDDGCGGVCGTCTSAQTCVAGTCTDPAGACGGLTFEGCCTTAGVTQWCENDAVQQADCAGSGAVCAWDAAGGYFNCLAQPAATPPGATYLCGGETCTDSCTGLECGFACGEICGGCPSGESCGASNTCEACACDPAQECGVDACGNSCGTCGANAGCNSDDVCVFNPCAADVGLIGCCSGNLSLWCEDGAPKGSDCADGCGWDDANGFHDCGQTGADPSGTNPLECPAIGPQ